MSDVSYAWLGHRATPVPVPQGTPGGYVFTSEAAAVFGPSRPRPGQYRGVVFAHGLGGVAFDFIARIYDLAGKLSSIQWALADRGFVCATPDLGGTDTFGNENGWTGVKNAAEQLVALWGAKAGKQTLIGGSMGGTNVGNFAIRYPELVHHVVFFITPFDMRDVHQDNALGAADNIEACYADYPGGWEAAMPEHNLIERAEDFAATGLTAHIYSAISDGVCEWQFAVDFCHAVNAAAGDPDRCLISDLDGLIAREAPTDDDGADGEYLLHVTGTEQLLYGPKAAGAWPAPVAVPRLLLTPSVPHQATITVTATGGTMTVTVNGQTTPAQAYNVAPATLEAALVALSTVGPGDVVVTKAGSVYTLAFAGALGGNATVTTAIGVGSLTGGTATLVSVPVITPAPAVGDYLIMPFVRQLYGPATTGSVFSPTAKTLVLPSAPSFNAAQGTNGHSGNWLAAHHLVDELLKLGAFT